MVGAIEVREVTKRLRVPSADQRRTIKEVLIRGFGKAAPGRVWELRDISFAISPGHAVGIVGRNGAGKSTLLRLVAGVIKPDRGTIIATGRIGALLDIGAGFTADLTGRENVFIAGVVTGLTRQEVAKRFDEIVAFAELEDFIDHPLRTYSTGMRMRLAFSVSVHVDPDILLIDEVLAVGDIAFQRKCLERIAAIKQRGCTILIVSHDLAPVKTLCDRVLFLQAGRVAAYGPTEEVLASYEASTDAYNSSREVGVPDVPLPCGQLLRYGVNRFGTLEAAIETVRIMTAQGDITDVIRVSDPLVVEIDYRTAAPLKGVKAQVKICLKDGSPCLDATSETAMIELPASGRASLQVLIERLDLAPGEYDLSVGLHEADWQYSLDNHLNVYPLRIEGSPEEGLLSPPIRWTFLPGPAASGTVRTGFPDRPAVGRQG